MGMRRGYICKECGKKFEANVGSSMTFHLLHCNACGEEKNVDKDEFGDKKMVEALLTACKCGGRYKFSAALRCPKCKSIELEYNPNGFITMYD